MAEWSLTTIVHVILSLSAPRNIVELYPSFPAAEAPRSRLLAAATSSFLVGCLRQLRW